MQIDPNVKFIPAPAASGVANIGVDATPLSNESFITAHSSVEFGESHHFSYRVRLPDAFEEAQEGSNVRRQ